MPSRIQIENTYLLPGLFKERADINRAYLMELKSENLLQNFLLEDTYIGQTSLIPITLVC